MMVDSQSCTSVHCKIRLTIQPVSLAFRALYLHRTQDYGRKKRGHTGKQCGAQGRDDLEVHVTKSRSDLVMDDV
jgi:hypothetical protein